MGDVHRIRPDAPADGTVRVVSTFGPDGIDATDFWAELVDRLGPAGLAEVLDRQAKFLRSRAKVA